MGERQAILRMMPPAARSGLAEAVFLDRDGTITEDVHYCRRPEDVRLLPGAANAIALLNKAGMPVVVVTNQSGISRGYFDWETLRAIHEELNRALARQHARVDAIYVCPHHPDDGCVCRKPRPGLLLRAAAELGLELSGSYVVGDQTTDMLAGRACGCTTVLVDTGPSRSENRSAEEMTPDFHAGDLYAAAEWIVNHARSRSVAQTPS